MESKEYMNRKSKKQRREAEVSILIIITTTIIIKPQQMLIRESAHLWLPAIIHVACLFPMPSGRAKTGEVMKTGCCCMLPARDI